MDYRLLMKRSKITFLWHIHPPHHWFFIGRFCLLILSLRSWFLLKNYWVNFSTLALTRRVSYGSSNFSICGQYPTPKYLQEFLLPSAVIISLQNRHNNCSFEQKEELSEGLETSATGEGPSLALCLPFANKCCKLPLISPRFIQVRKGFWVGL